MPSLLLVEDNAADVLLFRKALHEVRPDVCVFSVPDGAEALDFLYQRGLHSDAPRCDLILLDLNMAGLDGHLFLEIVRVDHELRHLPVAIWSASSNTGDVMRAYSEGANVYYRKRHDYEGTKDLVRGMAQHWFATAQLPV